MHEGALAGVRVLDLTNPSANFGVKLMAGFGAEIIKVEPPGGDALRAMGPFAAEMEGPETSLPFIVNNFNKRGITLDLDSPAGQRLFRRLAGQCDVVVETAAPGWMDARGVGYAGLSALNEGLVYVAVTPYGQTGPRAAYQASEFTIQATGGALHLTGDPGERPVRGAWLVADKMAGYTSATAALFALYCRNATGKGQFVDVSMQEAVASQMESSAVAYWFSGAIRQRNGWRYPTTTCPAGIYPCVDGEVSIVASKPHQWTGLRDWIADDRLFEERYMIEANRYAERDYIDPIVIAWTKTMPKSVLFHEGQRRGVPIGESMTPGDLVRDVHLLQRGYIVAGDHPVLGPHRMPGAPYGMSETPWRFERPAPLLGEHNDEVYGEAGLSSAEIAELRAEGVI